MIPSSPPVGPMQVLVLEDEWLARSYLVELLQGTGLAHVAAAVATTNEAEQALSEMVLEAAFVDVRLTGLPGDESGLEWVRKRARTPGAPRFVLATAFKEHAVEAFDLAVADYLVKPYTEERVEECVRRLLATGRPRAAAPVVERIVARRQRALVFLDLPEVWACEASERHTFVHSARGRFDLDLTLSAIAASCGRALVRVHRNWLVNPARVLEFERREGETFVLVGDAASPSQGGVMVPVSRERAQAFRDFLVTNAIGVRRF